MAVKRWSEQQRDMVIRMVAERRSRGEIAKALKTSVSSLRRHFNDVLNHEGGTEAKQFSDAERASAIAMSSYGAPQDEIAQVLGVSKVCLLKHLGDEMRSAPSKANAAVARSLYRKAVTDGDVNAQKYWLKNRAAGWEDRVSIDGSLAVSGEVSVEHSVVLADTIEQLSAAGRDALRIVLTEVAEAREASKARDARAIEAA